MMTILAPPFSSHHQLDDNSFMYYPIKNSAFSIYAAMFCLTFKHHILVSI